MSEQASDGEQQACTPALPHNGSAAKAIGLPPTAPLACPTHAPGFPGVGWSATHTHTHTHTHCPCRLTAGAAVANLQHGAPLGEAGTLLVVLGTAAA